MADMKTLIWLVETASKLIFGLFTIVCLIAGCITILLLGMLVARLGTHDSMPLFAKIEIVLGLIAIAFCFFMPARMLLKEVRLRWAQFTWPAWKIGAVLSILLFLSGIGWNLLHQ